MQASSLDDAWIPPWLARSKQPMKHEPSVGSHACRHLNNAGQSVSVRHASPSAQQFVIKHVAQVLLIPQSPVQSGGPSIDESALASPVPASPCAGCDDASEASPPPGPLSPAVGALLVLLHADKSAKRMNGIARRAGRSIISRRF